MDRISYLLSRYLDNECTRQEMDELLDYIEQNPEDVHLRSALRKAWDSEEPIVSMGECFPADAQESMLPLAASGQTVDVRKFAWKIAACILLLALGFSGYFFWQGQLDESLAGNELVHENAVVTANGEHRLTVLADGSKVWINGDSKLTCDSSFNQKTRQVTLSGEAYFDIRPDATRPFIIRTGKVTTTVLGTAFNVRAFPAEGEVTVTVTRGKVRVEDENKKGETITANEQITMNLKSEQLEEHSVDAGKVSQWITGDLILHEVTLGEAEGIVEERYSVDIRFDNALLKRCRFTSTFFQRASLDEVMTAICLVNGATYKVDGKVITIYGKGCDG